MSALNKCFTLALIMVALVNQAEAHGQTTLDDGSDPALETSDRDFNKSYRILDSYLTDHVSTDDIDLNMKVAAELLSKNLKEDPTKNERLNAALKLFTSLKDTFNGKKCDHSGYDILFKNLLATERCGLGRQSERRIDKVVYKFLYDHARNCQSQYPINFAKIYAKMDPNKRSQVEFFLNDFNLQDFLGETKHINTFYRTLVKNQRRIEAKNGPRRAYDAIYALSVGDEDRKYLQHPSSVVRKEKIRKLFKKYIIEPCKYFVDELGPEIFEPSRFDAMFYHRVNDEPNFLFYNSWARFKVCLYVLDNEDTYTYALVNGSVDPQVMVYN